MSGGERPSTSQLFEDLRLAIAGLAVDRTSAGRMFARIRVEKILNALRDRVVATLEAPVPIGEAWASYSAALLDPIGAGAAQREETRRAFYAGAAAMFSAVLEGADLEEDAAAARLEALDRELADYLRLFKHREGIPT